MRRTLLFISLVMLALLFAGCNSSRQTAASVQTIKIAGSTSMLPVSETLAQYYEKKTAGIHVNVQGGDSTIGMRGIINGIVDIGALSRPLTTEEQKELNSFEIAVDELSIITNPENPVQRLDYTIVRDLFSGKITNWKELGGPDHAISVIVREEGSGTDNVFKEAIMGDTNIYNQAAVLPSTGAVKAAVARDKYAIGYISSNYLSKEIKPLIIIIISGEKESHILTRHLVYVTKKQINPSVKAFLDFTSSDEAKKLLAGLEKSGS